MKRAFITGGGRRVGRAIALELARSGFDVGIHFRGSRDEADEVVEACRRVGSSAFALGADLEDPEQTRSLARAILERWSSLTLLVHNASLFVPRSFDETSLEDMRRMWAIHVEAPFLLTQALLPALRAGAEPAGLESSLVAHMVDIAAERPFYGYTAYSVSKAGLAMLVKTQAVELAPAIRSVGIAPGHVVWPPDYDEATQARMLKRIPQGRVGTPEEAARLVRFLCLEGTYINGDIIRVDGGLATRY
jgi:pteridine reductase